jgi:hypothetical protein
MALHSSQSSRPTRSNMPMSNLTGNTQEITNSTDTRKYLETCELTVPIGGEVTAQTLVNALFYILGLKGVTLPAKNTVILVAYLLKEIDMEQSIRGILDSVESRHVVEQKELSKIVDCHMASIQETLKDNLEETQRVLSSMLNKAPLGTGEVSYWDALMQPNRGRGADPHLVAREEIKKRQVLMDKDANDSELQKLDNPSIMKHLNDIITKIDNTGNQKRMVKTARKLPNRGIILEMGSAETARWLQEETASKLKDELRQAMTFKKRSHNTIAFFVLLTFNPNSKTNMDEVLEVNDLEKGAILKAKLLG